MVSTSDNKHTGQATLTSSLIPRIYLNFLESLRKKIDLGTRLNVHFVNLLHIPLEKIPLRMKAPPPGRKLTIIAITNTK